MHSEHFTSFLESLKTPQNKSLLNTILEGYQALNEANIPNALKPLFNKANTLKEPQFFRHYKGEFRHNTTPDEIIQDF